MRKIFKISVVLLVIAVLFTACKQTTPENTDEETSVVSSDQVEEILLSIINDGNTEYSIVTSISASSEISVAVNSFKQTVKDNTGVSFKTTNDYKKEDADTAGENKEILIGATNRKASSEAMSTLRSNDYVVSQYKNQLVIVGGSDNATIEALEKFTENYFSKDTTGNMRLSASDFFELKNEYPISTLMLNGKNISEYRIVYPKDSIYLKPSAHSLWNAVSSKCGIDLKVVDDSVTNENNAPEIRLGKTSRSSDVTVEADNVLFGVNGVNIEIMGDTMNNTLRGVDRFAEQYLSGEGEVTVTISNNQNIEIGKEYLYTTMSFNILYSFVDENGTERAPTTADAILSVMPDTLGVQECTTKWKNALNTILGEAGYASVGEVNHPNVDRYNLIFYRTDKLKLIETKTWWLSSTPDKISRFEIAFEDHYNICTYALFEDIETGERFAHFNTHLDIVRIAAEMQLRVLQDLTEKCEYPYVVTGDFNICTTWKQYTYMQETWYDSRLIADDTTNDPTGLGGDIIDYCMVNNGIVVSKYDVLNDGYVLKKDFLAGNTNGQPTYISDHWPVYIKYNVHQYN